MSLSVFAVVSYLLVRLHGVCGGTDALLAERIISSDILAAADLSISHGHVVLPNPEPFQQ
eukprot:9455533-Pyramimonas_sp.AAC.1